MKLSKKYKLPKRFWTKGKSKFLSIRLQEDGVNDLAALYALSRARTTDIFVQKRSWWQKIMDWWRKQFPAKSSDPIGEPAI